MVKRLIVSQRYSSGMTQTCTTNSARWFETSHECNPYECPCVLPYFPGLRTDQQCEIDCEKGNGLFHGIFSLCLISFLCFAGAMFAYVHPHVYSHSIPYALAASSCVFMAAILITQPAAWVSSMILLILLLLTFSC